MASPALIRFAASTAGAAGPVRPVEIARVECEVLGQVQMPKMLVWDQATRNRAIAHCQLGLGGGGEDRYDAKEGLASGSELEQLVRTQLLREAKDATTLERKGQAAQNLDLVVYQNTWQDGLNFEEKRFAGANGGLRLHVGLTDFDALMLCKASVWSKRQLAVVTHRPRIFKATAASSGVGGVGGQPALPAQWQDKMLKFDEGDCVVQLHALDSPGRELLFCADMQRLTQGLTRTGFVERSKLREVVEARDGTHNLPQIAKGNVEIMLAELVAFKSRQDAMSIYSALQARTEWLRAQQAAMNDTAYFENNQAWSDEVADSVQLASPKQRTFGTPQTANNPAFVGLDLGDDGGTLASTEM